jgi:3-phosphoshikimate 1-carboxyvinyltransferase
MSDFSYPPELEIAPPAAPPNADVTVPGSKSITNRALVLAALASRETECTLTGALRSEDTEVMVEGLRRLGFRIEAEWDRTTIVIRKHGSDRLIPAESADLFVANSGTTARFLAAMVSLSPGRYRLDGVPRMRERPIQDLLDALGQLGVGAVSERNNGCPPIVISGNGWTECRVRVRGDVSSQFLSGLLLAAGWAGQDTSVLIDGVLVSKPYVEMTLDLLESWVEPVGLAGDTIVVWTNRLDAPREYPIEPDASAASYFWAAAAITGGRVTVAGLTRDSLQGDVRFVDLLEQMGCRVETCDSGITVHGRPFRGIDADMNDISDTVMTLAAVACFAEGPTTIRNVAHIRHKETDRLAALATELRKLGAGIEERPDGLTITPRPLKGCPVDTYNDHRMAMSLALVGLKVPGVVIRNPGCVAKTYPGFWQDLDKLRGPRA